MPKIPCPSSRPRRAVLLPAILVAMTLPASAQAPSLTWAGSLGGPYMDSWCASVQVATDACGNVYIGGVFQNAVDFDPGPGTTFLNSQQDSEDFYVAKLDVAGQLQWAHRFGGDYDETLRGIAVDAAGNVHVGGYFRGTVDFDPGPGTHYVTVYGSEMSTDMYVLVLDADGDFVRVRRWDLNGFTGLALDAAANTYVTGYFQGTEDFDPESGVTNLTAAGSNDAFVLKLDSTGSLAWARHLGGTGNDVVHGIALDLGGAPAVVGRFEATCDFNPGPGTSNLTSAGGSDGFLVRLDTSGNLVSAHQVGGPQDDAARSIAIDGTGNVILDGQFRGTADFDPGMGIHNLTALSSFGDAFFMKLDTAGSFSWARQLSNPSTSSIGGPLLVDAQGKIHLAGRLSGNMDLDPGAGVFHLTSAGSDDIYLLQLTSAGNFVWAGQMGGAFLDRADDLAFDGAGDLLVGGIFWGTADVDPGTGVFNLTATGTGDGFLTRLSPPRPFILTASTTGGGTGDFVLGTSRAPAASDHVWVLGSATPAPGGPGTGLAFGLVPDAFFFQLLLAPPVPYGPTHFPTVFDPYCAGPLVFPPGTFSALAGFTWELTALAYDPLVGLVAQAPVVTVAW